jgi:hypothetical protein
MDLHSSRADAETPDVEVYAAEEHVTEHPALLLVPHVEIPGCSNASTEWVDDYRVSVLNAIRDGLKALEKALSQAQKNENEEESSSREEESSSDPEDEGSVRWKKPCVIVGVKDFRTEVPHKVNPKDDELSALERLWVDEEEYKQKDTRPQYVPLSMMILKDIEETFSDRLTIREFFMCVPHGYHCKSQTPISVLKKELHEERERWKRETILRSHGIIHEELLPIVQAHYFVFELNK